MNRLILLVSVVASFAAVVAYAEDPSQPNDPLESPEGEAEAKVEKDNSLAWMLTGSILTFVSAAVGFGVGAFTPEASFERAFGGGFLGAGMGAVVSIAASGLFTGFSSFGSTFGGVAIGVGAYAGAIAILGVAIAVAAAAAAILVSLMVYEMIRSVRWH